jgi:hypothetical protein
MQNLSWGYRRLRGAGQASVSLVRDIDQAEERTINNVMNNTKELYLSLLERIIQNSSIIIDHNIGQIL